MIKFYPQNSLKPNSKNMETGFNLFKGKTSKRLSMLFSVFLLTITMAWAHAVQVGYVILPNGFIRVYIEHWHGALSTQGLVGNGMSITTTYGSTTLTQNVNPSGAFNGYAWNQLPGAGANITILSTSSYSNRYNNWAYYDFAPAACNVPVSITLNGGLTAVLIESEPQIWPQTISGTFNDTSAPTITPSNTNASVSCGVAGANVNFTATALDNCTQNPTVTYSIAPGSFFPVGTTNVTAYSSDANGNSGQLTFPVTVSVIDNVPPTLSVPSSISTGNSTGICGATVTYATPIAADACSSATLTQIAGKASGSVFPIGTTVNTFKATDASGNSVTASFNVTVNDTEAPNALGKNISIAITANGTATVSATDINDGSNDNCGPITLSITSGLTSFDCSKLGANQVTLTATDRNGNSSSTIVTVTVTDPTSYCNHPPIVVAKALTLSAGADCSANAIASAFDNGSTDPEGDAISFTVSPVGPYSIGVTAVTLTATDTKGASSSIATTVTVVDDTPPTVTAQNVTVQLNAAGIASIVTGSILSEVFSEKFTNDPNGLLYSLTNWTFGAAGQNVDVGEYIANNNSKEIDLAGNNNAKIISKRTFLFAPGTYQITFDNRLNNNPAGGNSVNLSIGSLLNQTFISQINAVAESATFTVTTPTSAQIVFDQLGPDDAAGSLIGNIKLSRVINPNYSVLVSATDASGVDQVSVSKSTFDCSNVGVNSVVLTVTDVYGNQTVKNATVTVEDKIAPIVLVQNKTIQLDAAGAATITAADINNGSTDNCGIATVVLSKTSFDCSNYGANTVTLTVTDIHGNVSTKDAVVTVEDKVAPIVLVQNKTIQLDGSGAAIITAADINNGSTDNCGIATVELSKTSFDCSNYGANTVTLTVTDIHGNVSTKDAVVTVEDKVAPIVLVQNKTIQLNASGAATITASDINNGSTDNCAIQSVVLSKTSFDCSNYGANTVTLTVTDIHGNVSSATATVTVEDKIAPIITAPISQEICFVAAGTYTLPVLVSTDNCAVASTSYVLSGDTQRSGTGNDASGIINTGLTTITWTVTDVHGNVSTASNTIRIWPLPVVTLASSSPDEFCNKVTLVPTSTIPAVSYNWVYNNSTFSAGATLALGIANQDGEYKLYVTDIHGCVNTQIASYIFKKQDAVSSYTILGLRSVKLGENNNVQSGSVGAMGNKGKVEVKKYSSINSPGAFVKAQSIKVDKNAIVPIQINAPVVTSLPTMQYFTGYTKNLAKYEVKNNGNVNGNYSELTIKKGLTVTVSGNLFGKIKIEDGAQVTFTSSVLNIMNLDVDGSSSKSNQQYTNIKFSTDAVVKVSDKVDIEDHVKLNPDGKKVIFYVGSIKDHSKFKGNHDEDDKCPNFKKDDDHRDRDNDRDDEGDDYYGKGEFKVNGGDAYVTASVYVPEGKIKVNGSEKATSYLTGTFIAEYVESNVKNVIWNSFSCDASNTSGNNLLTTNGAPSVLDKSALGINLSVIEEPAKLLAYPNPFAQQTTVSFSLPYAEQSTTLDIFDLKGVRIQTLYKGTANANQNYEVKFDGSRIAAGTYFFRLTTSKEVKNFKVVMTN